MTPGQIAYEAYCAKTNWKSLATGADLPRWDKLNVNIQEAWETAAQAVLDTLNNLAAGLQKAIDVAASSDQPNDAA